MFEVNEAFAPVLIAWSADTGASLEKTNVNGGAIALGHPLGATGAVLATKLLHELERTGGRYGLQTMCEGGGQANATIIERVGAAAAVAAARTRLRKEYLIQLQVFSGRDRMKPGFKV